MNCIAIQRYFQPEIMPHIYPKTSSEASVAEFVSALSQCNGSGVPHLCPRLEFKPISHPAHAGSSSDLSIMVFQPPVGDLEVPPDTAQVPLTTVVDLQVKYS